MEAERLAALEILFETLSETSGTNDKKDCVALFHNLYPQYWDDVVFCLEVLDGQHKLGWKMDYFNSNSDNDCFDNIKDAILFLIAHTASDKSVSNIIAGISMLSNDLQEFLIPIVNRELRLGIGKSLLDVHEYQPMLALRYEKKPLNGIYYVTEKVDGNRCMAWYAEGKWNFLSRSFQVPKVDFNMSNLDKQIVYDGEIHVPGLTCQKISGICNSDNDPQKANLIFWLFDIMNSDLTYRERRQILESQKESNNVKVLPVLGIINLPKDAQKLMDIYSPIIERQGEGVMLNKADAMYIRGPKRGNWLVKLKDTWDMDMTVVGVKAGNEVGKYADTIGSLECVAESELDGVKYNYRTFAGGLTDDPNDEKYRGRTDWIGKRVKVICNGITQNASSEGTLNFSVRHARVDCIVNKEESTD